MKRINYEKIASFYSLMHNVECVNCGQPSTRHIVYEGKFFNRGSIPLCEACFKELVKVFFLTATHPQKPVCQDRNR